MEVREGNHRGEGEKVSAFVGNDEVAVFFRHCGKPRDFRGLIGRGQHVGSGLANLNGQTGVVENVYKT